jgi:hypothetical protein
MWFFVFCDYISIDQIVDAFTICIGSCAFIVSCFALIISIWQGSETRKNYRLSAKPYVSFIDSFIAGSDFVGIKITNKGLGPAIIKDILISFNSHTGFNINQQYDFSLYIKNKLKVHKKAQINFSAIDRDAMLMAGESIDLVFLDKSDNDELIKQLHNVIDGSSITIFYQSLYGEDFVFKKFVGISKLK